MPTYVDSNEGVSSIRLFEVIKEDEDYLVSLAKQKGYEDSFIHSLYVVAIAEVPLSAREMGIDDVGDKFIVYSEQELKRMALEIDRFFYDEKGKRLMGFIPPTNIILGRGNV